MPGNQRTVGTSFDDLLRQLRRATGSLTMAVSGDLAGALPSPTVKGLRGRTVASTAPSDGQGLVWDAGASAWGPATIPTASSVQVFVPFVYPLGPKNSANKVFVLPAGSDTPIDGTVLPVLNGICRELTVDWSFDYTTLTLTFTDNCIPSRGDRLWVHYFKVSS